jgi:hypothetical protein
MRPVAIRALRQGKQGTTMPVTIDAIYDGEFLKPQVPLDLKRNQNYRITIANASPASNGATALAPRHSVLADRYTGIGDSQVCQFLQTQVELLNILAEAVGPIDAAFGTGTSISLNLVTDYDSDDDARLMARIRTTESVAAARAKRADFYLKWWNSNMDRAHGRLVFDLEYA